MFKLFDKPKRIYLSRELNSSLRANTPRHLGKEALVCFEVLGGKPGNEMVVSTQRKSGLCSHRKAKVP
jgi:hypothetical protein